MIEVGGRLTQEDWVARPFAAIGVTLPSDSDWSTRASLRSAADDTRPFTTEQNMPNVLGNLDLGLQILKSAHLEVKQDYALQFGEDYVGQYGGGRLAYRF